MVARRCALCLPHLPSVHRIMAWLVLELTLCRRSVKEVSEVHRSSSRLGRSFHGSLPRFPFHSSRRQKGASSSTPPRYEEGSMCFQLHCLLPHPHPKGACTHGENIPIRHLTFFFVPHPTPRIRSLRILGNRRKIKLNRSSNKDPR